MALTVEKHAGGVALVRIEAEAAKNAFDAETMQEISDTLNAQMDDHDLRAFILTGTGRFFSAGADINAFEQHLAAGTIGPLVDELTTILHPLLSRLRTTDKVYVAALNGAAAGAGLGLALSADYRVAGPDAKLAAAFFRLGLTPDGGTTWLLPRLVGLQRTKCFFFNNETWGPETALAYGAVDEVVDNDELLDRAIEVARKWGSWSLRSRRASKQLLDSQSSLFFDPQLDFEQMLITDAAMSDDFKEGVEAFLKKRDPEFS